MLEKARGGINRALERGIVGSNRGCMYFPCHESKGSKVTAGSDHDCTFCFCPFYPCLDSLTGGRFKTSGKTGKRVWSCMGCSWIHRSEVVIAVLNEIKKVDSDIDGIDSRKLKEIRLRIIGAVK